MPDAFAVPRPVLEMVGGFDEVRFPFHYEEADLGRRIRDNGLGAVVVGAAKVWHSGNTQENPGAEFARAFELSGQERVESMVRGRVAFHRRHSARIQRLVALGIFVPLYILVAVAASLGASRPLNFRLQVVKAVTSGALKGYTRAL